MNQIKFALGQVRPPIERPPKLRDERFRPSIISPAGGWNLEILTPEMLTQEELKAVVWGPPHTPSDEQLREPLRELLREQLYRTHGF